MYVLRKEKLKKKYYKIQYASSSIEFGHSSVTKTVKLQLCKCQLLQNSISTHMTVAVPCTMHVQC